MTQSEDDVCAINEDDVLRPDNIGNMPFLRGKSAVDTLSVTHTGVSLPVAPVASTRKARFLSLVALGNRSPNSRLLL
jgi:hypothetical protein